MEQQQFCLRWHNFQSNLLSCLPQFLNGNDLTDVTLSAGGRNIRAHRVVLSASSQYFKEIFKELQPLQHPVIVLPGMNYKDLCALLTFMYSGEVNIYQDQLPGLLSMADTLHIRGLAEVQGGDKPLSESSRKSLPSAMKRPRISLSPSPTPLINNNNNNNTSNINNNNNNSTNEDNLFKNPHSEPKTFKDLNENTMGGKLGGVNSNTSFFGLPYDDSTLQMMRQNKFGKSCQKLKSKKPGSLSSGFAIGDIFHPPGLPYVRPFTDEHMEAQAQDLSKVRETDIRRDMDPACDLPADSEIFPTDFKSENHSPESDDSGGGLGDGFGSGGLGRTLSGQSKGYATCTVCNKQLSNQYNLRVHMETHLNVQYSCTVCHHVSRSRDALRKHVSYRHPGEGKEMGKKAKLDITKRPLIKEENDGDPHQPGGSPLILSQLSLSSP